MCEHASITQEGNFIKELEILYDAVRMLGSKGEQKITQWIRGSGLARTNRACLMVIHEVTVKSGGGCS